MARPTETLARKIAKHTGVAEADVQYMFDNPPAAMSGACWPWRGTCTGPGRMTPTTFHNGRAVPVRLLLVGPKSKVLCFNPFCVNPSHALKAEDRIVDDEPEAPAGADEIDELLEMLLEGFTEAQLLTMYEPGTVAEALRLSRTPL